MHFAILIGAASERGSGEDHEFLAVSQGFMEHNDVPITEH
jgi:hypothetical protein